LVLSFHNFRSSDYSNFTEAALVNALTQTLSSKYECDLYEDENICGGVGLYVFHPYLNQAEGWIYKINLYRPPPVFVIWREDIPIPLTRALLRLSKVAMNRVITGAVRGIYESVDADYFHANGLYGKIRWGFDKPKK
jgi:hypothetical protein